MSFETVVVGCGSIGSRHIGNLSRRNDVTVTAHDIDSEQLQDVADEYGISGSTDLDALLTETTDCVFVCTPPDTHVEIANAALDVGAHVFVEKPLSSSVADTQEFVRRARELDLTVYVACNMRFHPPVERIQQWLDSGEIGRLQFVRLRYGNDLRNWRSTEYTDSYSTDESAGGGIIRDAVHELDLALEWMPEITSLYCAAGTVGELDIDVEDTAEILLESTDCMAEIHLDYVRPERARTYELVGSDGIIRWTARGKNPETSEVGLYRRDRDDWQRETFELTLNEQYVAEIEDFFNCVRQGQEPPMDAERGRTVLSLAEQARTAAVNERKEQFEAGSE
jgi:predicted dehydrogenase